MTKPLIEQVIHSIKHSPKWGNPVFDKASTYLAFEVIKGEDFFITTLDDSGTVCLKSEGGRNWNPFTNANHTRKLVRSVREEYSPEYGNLESITAFIKDDYSFPYILYKEPTGYRDCIEHEFVFIPYGDDPTYDSCQILRLYAKSGRITEETQKEWLNA